jgi:hypothetical protein
MDVVFCGVLLQSERFTFSADFDFTFFVFFFFFVPSSAPFQAYFRVVKPVVI